MFNNPLRRAIYLPEVHPNLTPVNQNDVDTFQPALFQNAGQRHHKGVLNSPKQHPDGQIKTIARGYDENYMERYTARRFDSPQRHYHPYRTEPAQYRNTRLRYDPTLPYWTEDTRDQEIKPKARPWGFSHQTYNFGEEPQGDEDHVPRWAQQILSTPHKGFTRRKRRHPRARTSKPSPRYHDPNARYHRPQQYQRRKPYTRVSNEYFTWYGRGDGDYDLVEYRDDPRVYYDSNLMPYTKEDYELDFNPEETSSAYARLKVTGKHCTKKPLAYPPGNHHASHL